MAVKRMCLERRGNVKGEGECWNVIMAGPGFHSQMSAVVHANAKRDPRETAHMKTSDLYAILFPLAFLVVFCFPP